MVDVYGFVFFCSGIALLFFLFRFVFAKGERKRSMALSGVAFLAATASVFGFVIASDREAIEQGYLDSLDRTRANDSGYTDPAAWAEVRAELEAASNASEIAEAAAKAEVAEAVDSIAAYVTGVTRDLPERFEDHGVMIPLGARMQPLAEDALAYARFYWTVDSIEANCQFLGQRTNIQLLVPGNGVTSWVTTAATYEKHPNYEEFIAIFDKFERAVTELGETAVCSAMYRLLGPNGSLMDDALEINGLIDPEMLYRFKVRVEDGVLWSSRDYCERRYYLDDANQPTLHEITCNEAKAQDF